jgi:hypothetical protein
MALNWDAFSDEGSNNPWFKHYDFGDAQNISLEHGENMALCNRIADALKTHVEGFIEFVSALRPAVVADPVSRVIYNALLSNHAQSPVKDAVMGLFTDPQ